VNIVKKKRIYPHSQALIQLSFTSNTEKQGRHSTYHYDKTKMAKQIRNPESTNVFFDVFTVIFLPIARKRNCRYYGKLSL